VDIANSGARLADLREPLSLGEIIEVDCDRRNAVFRVVWIGSPGRATEGQAGITCLTPETNIWGLHLSQQMDEEPLPQEIAVARAVADQTPAPGIPPLRTLDYRGHCIPGRVQ